MAAVRSSRAWLYTKVFIGGAAVCIGGPALTMYLSPTDEELVKRYNPELRKRSEEGRVARQQEFDDFVMKLKEQSKSKKSIWFVQAEEAQKQEQRVPSKESKPSSSSTLADETKTRKEEMRRQAGL